MTSRSKKLRRLWAGLRAVFMAGGSRLTTLQAHIERLEARVFLSTTELLANPSFSSGAVSWVASGDFWAGTTLTNYHTAPGYAAGGVDNTGSPKNNSSGSIYQQISIPPTATSAAANWWYYITSQETAVYTQYDKMQVVVQNASGQALTTLTTYSNLDKDSGYQQSQMFDLSAYIGQTVRLAFLATTDSNNTTVFRIDDISVSATLPDVATPSISSVSPASPTATGSAQTFTINGSNFAANATVTLWDITTGETFANRTITSQSSTQITISPNFGTTDSTWKAQVFNGSTGSNQYQFSVVAPAIPVSDGFDYPIGNDHSRRYTEANDGDGWYDAQDFGDYNSAYGKYHLGEDWNGESGGSTDLGQPVYATSAGLIISAGTASGWGKVLIIRHKLSDGTLVESLYGHLQSFAKTSGTVSRGEQVGTIGDGDGLYPGAAHLHFEIRFSSCPNWGSPGPGYSVTPKPPGWTDPSDFIDAHRPAGLTLSHTYALTRDLNLISFPFTPRANGSSRFSDILAPLGNDVFPYVFYLQSNGTVAASAITDLNAEAKKGYFIFMNSARTLSVTGDAVDSLLILNRDLNLVGVTSDGSPPANANVFPTAFWLQGANVAPTQIFQDVLNRGNGYFVFSNTDGNVLIPGGQAVRSSFSTESPMMAGLLTSVTAPSIASVVGQDFTGTITVAQSGATNNRILAFGMKNGSTDGFDEGTDVRRDIPMPGGLEAFFDDGSGPRMKTNYKSPADSKEWPLAVFSQSSYPGIPDNLNPVALSWTIPSVGSVDSTAAFQLLDASRNVLVADMRSTSSYSFPVGAAGTEKDFIIRASIAAPDRPPVVNTFTADPNPVTSGQSCALAATASDPDAADSISAVKFFEGTTLLGTGSLSSGQWTYNWNTAGHATGTFFITAFAYDMDNTPSVSATTMVTIEKQGGGVDLSPTDVYLTANGNRVDQPELGQTYTVWFTITWQGSGSVTIPPPGFQFVVQLDGAIWSQGVAGPGTFDIPVSYAGGAGPWVASTGSHTFRVTLDTGNVIAESDKQNNTIARSFTVGANVTAIGGAVINVDASQPLDSMIIDGSSRVNVGPGGGNVLRVTQLSIAAGGVLDLANNAMIVQTANSAARDQMLQYLTGLIKQARAKAAGKLWQGSGITTSAASPDDTGLTGLAVVANFKLDQFGNPVLLHDTWLGQTVDINSILIKYTWNGDVNVDGIVNFDDYYRINSGFLSNGTLSGYQNGDFNFDGIINFDDYFMINSAFLGQGNTVMAAAPAGAVAGRGKTTKARRREVQRVLSDLSGETLMGAHRKSSQERVKPRRCEDAKRHSALANRN